MPAYPEESGESAAASVQHAQDLAVKRSSVDGLGCESCQALNTSPRKRYRAEAADQTAQFLLSATPAYPPQRLAPDCLPDESRWQSSSAFIQAFEDPFDSDSEDADIGGLLCEETGAGYETTLEPPVPNFSCLTPPARFAASEQPPAPKSKRTMSRVASLDQWMEDPYGVEESATATSLATRGTLLEDVAENSQSSSTRTSYEAPSRKAIEGTASSEEETSGNDKAPAGQPDPILRRLFEACCQKLDAATVFWPAVAEKAGISAMSPTSPQNGGGDEHRMPGQLVKKGSFSFR